MVTLKHVCATCIVLVCLVTQAFAGSGPENAGNAVTVTGNVLIRNEDGKNTRSKQLRPGDVIEPGTVINTSSNGGVKLLMTDKSILDLGPSTLFKVNEYAIRGGGNRKVEMTLGYGKMRAAVNTKITGDGKFRVRTRSATMGVRGTEFIILTDLGDFVTPTRADAGNERGQSAPEGKAPSASSGVSVSENKDAGDGENAGDTGGRTQITVVEGKVEVTTGKGTDDEGQAKEEKSSEQKTVMLTEGTQLQTKNDTKEHKEEEKIASSDEGGRSPASETTADPVVTKLTVEEVNTISVDTKIEDQTFVQAVSIDGALDGPKSGNETLTQLSTDFTIPTDSIPMASDIKLPGTFGSNLAIDSSAISQVNSLPITVRVVFKR